MLTNELDGLTLDPPTHHSWIAPSEEFQHLKLKAFEFDVPLSRGVATPQASDRRAMGDWLHSWLTEFRILEHEAVWGMINRWRIPLFVQRTAPNCRTEEAARLQCAWMTWLHLFDDVFDVPAISCDPVAAQTVIRPYLKCIDDWRAGRFAPEASNDGLLNAFIVLNHWTFIPMSKGWRRQWLSDLGDYISAYVTETISRSTRSIPTPQDLIELKKICMAQRPALLLTERTITDELSPAARALVMPAADIVADITGCINDIVSLDRERERGDVHNLVLSLIHHESLDEHDAIKYVANLVKGRCHDLTCLVKMLPTLPGIQDEYETVTAWMKSCEYWAKGYCDWLLETGRYQQVTQ